MPFFSLYDRIKSRIGSWAQSRNGNVGMIFALAAIPLVMAGGMGIDIARAYSMRVRLSAALDAAALAVGSSPVSFTTAQLQQRMQNYFNANYPASALGLPTPPVMSVVAVNSVINFNATATIPTSFMQIVHVNSLTVNVSNQITRGASGLEVALVLDNTGSMMCGDAGSNNCSQGVPPSHMDTLRTDAQNIIQTLFDASPDPTKVKIAIGPYVTAVNVGPALGSSLNTYMRIDSKSGAYLDYLGNKILNVDGVTPVVYDPTQSPNSLGWIGCVVEATTVGEDNPNGTGPDIYEVPNVGWTPSNTPLSPYYWKSGTGTTYDGDANNIFNTWNVPQTNKNTHVVTQEPVAQYVEVDNGDYSNDSNSAIDRSYGPNLGCPTPLVRLTSDEPTLISAAQNLKSRANSGTAISVGMVWGWRALSPNPPFSDGQPYTAINNGWIKAVVLETDGDAQVFDTPVYGGYGYIDTVPGDNKLGATEAGPIAPNVTPGTANYNLQNRLTTLCTNMKNAGIVIYTIGLGQDGITNTQLTSCASSPANAYKAPTAAALTADFQEIANSLNNLRLSK